MSYGDDIEAAVEGMIEAALENFDPDVEGQIESWFYNSFDIETQVQDVIRYGGIDSSDISDLEDVIGNVLDYRLEDFDGGGSDVSTEVAALRAEVETIKDTMSKIAQVLTGPTSVETLGDTAPVSDDQMTLDEVLADEDTGYEAPYTAPTGLNFTI